MEETGKQQSTSATSGADQEREELLRAVADCAPKKWKPFLFQDVSAIEFVGCEGIGLDAFEEQRHIHLSLTNDGSDAEAIILMVDEIERRGYLTHLFSVRTDGGLLYGFKFKGGEFGLYETFRTTRAEAVAKAFVAVMNRGAEGK